MCPSANRYWRTYRGRKPTRSPEARAYLAQVRRLYRPTMFLERVAVRLDLHLCRGDIDNRAKVALDALKGIAYRDDKQVRSLQIEGYEASSRTEHILVRITPWVPVPPMELGVDPALAMHARHTDACITELLDPGAVCVCRPPAVEEPLVGRITPNVVRRKP
jgi:Holliday junction resolvase RusA-like endonuclease